MTTGPRSLVIVTMCASSLLAATHSHTHRAAAPHAAPILEKPAVHHTVTTSSASAQRAFDLGLTYVYSFNHQEAVDAFRRASRLDPHLAMAHWGAALALGPNINLDVDPEREKEAWEEEQKAQSLLKWASPRERDYVATLALRYSTAKNADLKELARRYSAAMRTLVSRYPDDLDAATLFAESAMDLRPWQLWNHDGTPAVGTPEIVATLESVLARAPLHVGANHYYIHAMEASPQPQKALDAAHRIATLVPYAGHLVHMPSHILMRVGDYSGASEANVNAVKVDRAWIASHGASGVYPLMYYNHNLDFLAAARAMEGKFGPAMAAVDELQKNVTSAIDAMPMLEGFLTRKGGVLLRFGRWKELLSEPEPPRGQPVSHAFWLFSRGMALAATGRVDDAMLLSKRLTKERSGLAADSMIGLNPSAAIFEVAAPLLESRIDRAAGRREEEIEQLRKAVVAYDALAYDEPADFYFPVREALGGALLRAGRAGEAKSIFEEELKIDPANPRATFGLAEALRMSGDEEGSRKRAAELSRVWDVSKTPLSVNDL